MEHLEYDKIKAVYPEINGERILLLENFISTVILLFFSSPHAFTLRDVEQKIGGGTGEISRQYFMLYDLGIISLNCDMTGDKVASSETIKINFVSPFLRLSIPEALRLLRKSDSQEHFLRFLILVFARNDAIKIRSKWAYILKANKIISRKTRNSKKKDILLCVFKEELLFYLEKRGNIFSSEEAFWAYGREKIIGVPCKELIAFFISCGYKESLIEDAIRDLKNKHSIFIFSEDVEKKNIIVLSNFPFD